MYIFIFIYKKPKLIYLVPVVNKLMLVPVSMFWLGSFPMNFDKTIEYPNWTFASNKYKNDYLLGNHAFNGSLHREDKHVSQQSSLVVTTVGFCNQLEEIYFGIIAGDQTFGAKNQLSQPRNISHRWENTECKSKISKLSGRKQNINFRINKSDWFVDINNSSSTASKITMSFAVNLSCSKYHYYRKLIHISNK